MRGDKAPLSRTAVIQAALTCLRKDGPPALTMRNVAGLLETGAASLYVYVSGQNELHALVLDSIAAEIPRPSVGADPASQLVELLMGYARHLFTYQGAARLALENPSTGPSFLDLLETALSLLVAQGFTVNRAALAADALFLLVTATMAEQDARRWDDPARSVANLYAAAVDGEEPSQRPFLSAARRDAFKLGGEERLEWMIRAFIAGLATAPEPIKEDL
jgi:AcrR family transcriptional regulator